jgi:hypothetical protein
MPTMAGKVTITAPGTSLPIVGQQYEYAPFDGTIEVALKSDRDLVTCSVFSGPDILAEPGSFVPKGASGEPPRVPDDYHWIDDVAKGDRLKVTLVDANTTGSSVVYWAVRLTPA